MNIRRLVRSSAALLVVLLVLPLAAFAGRPQSLSASIDPRVLQQTAGTNTATFWVILREKANLTPAYTMKNWDARGRFVMAQLQAAANRSQAGIRGLLQSRKVSHRPFWVVNTIRVTADSATVKLLAARPEVERIVPDGSHQIPWPQPGKTQPRIQAVEWNIDRIRAPEVWSTFGVRGEGIVIANIDSGVQFDHPALVAQYRGNQGGGSFDHNYNWFDPSNVCGSPSLAPCDNNGHGTHTMGTMVGDDGNPGANQIGVAPGARWIAAKGCEVNTCSDTALLASGQWVLAPTDLNGANPRPDLRPNIVNNSWGGGPGDSFYQDTVNAWIASGIFPQFANGNAGPGCGSAGSPGDYPSSYSAGAFDINNNIADFSSRGPSAFGGEIKPNIAAPGVDVRSSVPGNSYASFEGTSMASPHVAGTVALMWSAAPTLIGDIAATRALLDQTAVDMPDSSCDGPYPPPPGPNIDNNVWGEGRLDAFAAVDLSPRGPQGTIQGAVTGTGGPLAGVTIQAVGPSNRTTTTDASGNYSLILPVGTYDVTASAFGYLTQTANGVVVNEGTTTTQNFALAAAPSHAVSGHVRDGAGNPMTHATVTILGTPIPPTTTDTDGAYSFTSVPEGEYDLRATAGGCNDPQTQHLVVDGEETLDFALSQRHDSFGYFCDVVTPGYIQGDTSLDLSGDENAISLSLPFPFSFYGQTYNTAYVSTNGFLNFLALDAIYNNIPIPDPSTPNAAIYPFWDDLVMDGDSSAFTGLVDDANGHGFLIEWRNVGFYADLSQRVDFEVVLYENGYILTQYQNVDGNGREMGDSATLGLENEAGAIALQYSFNQAAIGSPEFAVFYGLPPSGFIQGHVTDANDHLPVSATVQALQNGAPVRTVTTDANGFYRTQVPVGTYDLEATATNYESGSFTVDVGENQVVTQDFVLRTARAEISPAAFDFVVPAGQTRTRTLTLRNTGSLDLTWEIQESGGASTAALPALPKLTRTPSWSKSTLPAGLPRATARSIAPSQLDTIINDPAGDAQGSVDITTVRGGGGDGPGTVSVAIDFNASTPMDQVVGYVFFDTDQNPQTGFPPEVQFGLPTQDIGVDYFADLFFIHEADPFVQIVDGQTFVVVAVVPAVISGHTISFDTPLAALGGDDGFIDVDMVLGDFFGPTDWAADVGHGTINPFTDVPWISENPSSGTLAPGRTQTIQVALNTAGLAPGVYHAILFVQSNSGRQPSLHIPVNLIVPAYQQGVNAGGGLYTDRTGDPWAADKAYVAGSYGYIGQSNVVSTKKAIAGTDDDPLYQNGRRGQVEYRFDNLPAGVYQVDLRFAEIQGSRRGQRIFDVLVEGALVLPAFDIIGDAGAANKADDKTFYVAVSSDGVMNIRLVTRRGFGEPLINAIRVTHRPDR